MGPPREGIKYSSVDPYFSKMKDTDQDTTKSEETRLLKEKDVDGSGLHWSTKMVGLDKQNGAGLGAKLPNDRPNKVQIVEPSLNWRQVMGCASAASINFASGISLAFTSSLIPELQDKNSDIKVTTTQCAWLASCFSLVVIPGAFFGGYLMDRVGRLWSVQLSVLPMILAWIVIALAPNYAVLLTGRIVFGFAFGVGPSAAAVLITEIALKKYRGPLSCCGIMFASFGILLGYIIGALYTWRTFAWIAACSPLVPFVLNLIFTAESPVWLRSRGRLDAARKACLYYYKDQDFYVLPPAPQPVPLPVTLPPLCVDSDIEKTSPTESKPQEVERDSFMKQLWLLLHEPSGYKPLLILAIILVLQQLSGIYITLFYAVTFFKTAGSPIDPYISTIMLGAMRFVACGMTIFLMQIFGRRSLMITSSLGMAVCMAGAGYSTKLVLDEKGGGTASFLPNWFPVGCVVMYILAASIGLQSIPWTMTNELFPQRVRGAAQALNTGVANIFTFTFLQLYPQLDYYLGGAVGLQYAFAGASLLAAVICWIFLPETHKKTLSEIENYFVHNIVYLGRRRSSALSP